MARLRTEAAAEGDAAAARPVELIGALDYIRNFAATWAKAQPPTRTSLIQSVYSELLVRGGEFVSVRLTPEAYANGLAMALPEEVEVPAPPTWGGLRIAGESNMVLARPTGFGPPGTHSGSRLVPIEGAGDWEAGCLRTA